MDDMHAFRPLIPQPPMFNARRYSHLHPDARPLAAATTCDLLFHTPQVQAASLRTFFSPGVPRGPLSPQRQTPSWRLCRSISFACFWTLEARNHAAHSLSFNLNLLKIVLWLVVETPLAFLGRIILV